MAGTRELRITILGDSSAGQRALRDLAGAADHTGGRLSTFGKVAAGALAGAGIASVGFLAKAVASASDLNETLSKVSVVFGDQARQVESFANQMAKDFGLPKKSILDAASSIGLIGKASGLSKGDAAAMANQLAKLAADASSFYNVPLDEALAAIQSGLVGEAEPMRRFGVLLNAQAVDAEAAALGLGKVNGQYTEGAKAQARASLIMKGMTDASGDLERTQGSLSNRLREMRGRFENFAASVGTAVVPVVLKLFDAFESLGDRLAPVFNEVSAGFKAFVAAFKAGDGLASSGFAGFMGKLAVVARQLFDALKPVGALIKANIEPILAGLGAVVLAVVVPALAALVASVVAAAAPFVALAAVVALVWPRIKEHVIGAVGAIVAWVQEQWPRVKEVISEAMVTVQAVIQGVTAVVLTVWENFGSQIVNVIKSAWDFIVDIVDAAMNVIRGVIDVVAGIITGDWSRVWDGVKSILSGVWDAMKALISTAIDLIKEIVKAGWEVVKGVFTGAWDALKQVVREGVAWVVDKILAMAEMVIGAAETAFGWIPFIGDKLRDAADKFEQFRNSVNASIRGITEHKTVTIAVRQIMQDSPGVSLGAAYHEAALERYQSGGWVKAPDGVPQLAVVHGGEYVVPADVARHINKGASMAAAPSGGGAGGTVVIEIPLVIDGRKVAEATARFTAAELRRLIGRNGHL
ncbi:MAG: phage tail protein [Acidimicrobiales bacterium]